LRLRCGFFADCTEAAKDFMKLSKFAGAVSFCFLLCVQASAAVDGWLNWRGPDQNGVSRETGLPDKISEKDALWSVDFPGASTAVVAGGHVYIMGYLGENGPDLQEGVACFDADTGKKLWDRLYNDYLSDTIYLRYATSSVGIDPETGNVYSQGTQGLLSGFTPDGQPLWSIPMMEVYGRLTFPNARTASPIVDGDLVITRGITANWGANGPAGDRFYAFDKKNGDLVWTTSSGARPTDNSFSLPYFTFLDGKRVMIASTGDWNIFCANARTGEGIWRIPIAKAGINASVLVHNNDKVIAIYGTPYEPGQLVALKIPHVAPTNAAAGPVVVERSQVELWSNPLSTSTSSPILVGDRIYVVSEKGSLCSVDVATGKTLWQQQIGIEQRNSSPLFADGKLYVPMLDDPQSKEGSGDTGKKGAFYVIKPTDQKGEILSKTVLDGRCFGSPTAYNGKVYVQTTRKFYCFGKRGNNSGLAKSKPVEWPKAGPATQLQIIPAEFLLEPGQSQKFRARSVDARGFVVQENIDPKTIKWATYIPPTARVRATVNGKFDQNGVLTVSDERVGSAGAFEATMENLKGYIRGRVMRGIPLKEDFESYQLTEKTTNSIEQPTAFAYPPLPWIGARFKFEIRDKDGTKTLTKTIDNKFFQRATVFIGPPELSNYTIEADVMSEGNKRKMSEVGLIAQRYLVTLKGNEQKLEISSNFERLRVPAASEPPNFKWSPNQWYHLKARVENQPDGSEIVRAKAWKKGEAEPEKWLLEVPHKTGHKNGSPGLFGFAPQAMRVFIDNIVVTKNQ
jgi:outer membrane protein assembly factor BamB